MLKRIFVWSSCVVYFICCLLLLCACVLPSLSFSSEQLRTSCFLTNCIHHHNDKKIKLNSWIKFNRFRLLSNDVTEHILLFVFHRMNSDRIQERCPSNCLLSISSYQIAFDIGEAAGCFKRPLFVCSYSWATFIREHEPIRCQLLAYKL